MYLIKVAEWRAIEGDRAIFETSARSFTIDGDTITYSLDIGERSIYKLNENDRVYIMDMQGNTLDKYILDTRPAK